LWISPEALPKQVQTSGSLWTYYYVSDRGVKLLLGTNTIAYFSGTSLTNKFIVNVKKPIFYITDEEAK
jgi:hypothetical protein